jgi:hypothetical protein
MFHGTDRVLRLIRGFGFSASAGVASQKRFTCVYL